MMVGHSLAPLSLSCYLSATSSFCAFRYPISHSPTMIKYGISNIRDLVGHKVDLQAVYDNPLCRLP